VVIFSFNGLPPPFLRIKNMIHEVRVYTPSGILQKVISKKALYKRSDRLIEDPSLFCKATRGRPKGRPKKQFLPLDLFVKPF